jgi:serine/threonine protein kinase
METETDRIRVPAPPSSRHATPLNPSHRPYRAPELLFLPRTYDPFALDLWSAGCVLAELFIRPAGAPTRAIRNLDTVSELDSSDEESPRISSPGAPTRMGRSGHVESHSSDIDEYDNDDDDDENDELEDTPPGHRSTLFDASFGDLGLAASIFRIRGSPTSERWKVGSSYSMDQSGVPSAIQLLIADPCRTL